MRQLSNYPKILALIKKLQGEVDFYRIRVGNYRMLYMIDDSAKLINIMRIMPRENAY
jgi:mRNA interferase RelE/StbE